MGRPVYDPNPLISCHVHVGLSGRVKIASPKRTQGHSDCPGGRDGEGEGLAGSREASPCREAKGGSCSIQEASEEEPPLQVQALEEATRFGSLALGP
jgi:hypothetical protein